MLTGVFPPSSGVYTQPFHLSCQILLENLWRQMLKANNKQVRQRTFLEKYELIRKTKSWKVRKSNEALSEMYGLEWQTGS